MMNKLRTRRINYFIVIFSFCVLCFLPYISFFTESKLPKETLPVYLVMVIVPFFSILLLRFRISKNICPLVIIWLLYMFEYWLSTMLTTKSPYMYSSVVIWAMELLVILYFANKTDWQEYFFKYLLIFSCIFMIAAIIQVFIPKLLEPLIKWLYPESITANMFRLVKNGYYTGLSSYITYQCHNILPIIGFSFATILLKNHSRKQYINWVCVCGLSMFSMIITNKRMPLVAMLLALCICFFVAIGNKVIRKRIMVIGSLMFVAFLVMMIFTSYGERILSRILESKGVENEARGYLWSSAVQLWFRRPFVGNGYASFSEFSNLSVHNSYLQVLCESGLIGFVLFLGIYFIPLNKAIFVYKKLGSNSLYSNQKVYLFTTIFYQSFCIIHSVTESVFHGTSLFLPFAIISAVPYSIEKQLKQEKRNVYS